MAKLAKSTAAHYSAEVSAELALHHLKQARDLLGGIGADRAKARVVAAISSAKGAVRHARHRDLAAETGEAANG